MPGGVLQGQVGGVDLLLRTAERRLELLLGGGQQHHVGEGVRFGVHFQRRGLDVELITHLQNTGQLAILVFAHGLQRHLAGGQLNGRAVVNRAFLRRGRAVDGVVIGEILFHLRLLFFGVFLPGPGPQTDRLGGLVGVGGQIALGGRRGGIIEGVAHAEFVADQCAVNAYGPQGHGAFLRVQADAVVQDAVLRQYGVIVVGVVNIKALGR